MDFDCAWGKPDHASHLRGQWFGTSLWHTWPDWELWPCHSSSEDIQIYPPSQNLRQEYKLYVTSHCKDIEQNSQMEGGMDERKERIKGSARMSQGVYCSRFSRPNVSRCWEKSTVPSCACLVMRVSNQASNCHPIRPSSTAKNMHRNMDETVLLPNTALLSLSIHISIVLCHK